MTKAKKIKDLLRDQQEDKKHIFEMLTFRLRSLKKIALREDDRALLRMVEATERFQALDDLYRSLQRKRMARPTERLLGEKLRFTPIEKRAIPVDDGLSRRIFKLN